MSEERLPCRTAGCENTIQPATAKRNNGYCGPCHNRIAYERRQKYIRENRKTIDPYEGVSDPVEMIAILHRKRRHDPLILELPCPQSADALYQSLSDDQADRLMAFAAEKAAGPEKRAAEQIARCLGAFTERDLSPLLSAYLEQDFLPPEIAFRGASDRFVNDLVKRLTRGKQQANASLLCLAWIGSPHVVEFFARTQQKIPDWADQLYVHPSRYTRYAGWEVRDGRRHDLFLRSCLAITQAESEDRGLVPSPLMQPRSDQCLWCKRTLVDMLRLSRSDPRLGFLPDRSETLRIPMCDMCTCYGDKLFFEKDNQGEWQWKQSNQRPEYLPDPAEDWGTQPWASAQLRFTPRPAHHAADPLLPTTFSQIGGLPAWVQDEVYPACCDCGLTMTFITQLDYGDFSRYEGTYYAFLCQSCETSTTRYQQT
jgi:hypothetical protein